MILIEHSKIAFHFNRIEQHFTFKPQKNGQPPNAVAVPITENLILLQKHNIQLLLPIV